MFMRSGRGVWCSGFCMRPAGRISHNWHSGEDALLPTWAAVQRKLSQLFAVVGSDQARSTRLGRRDCQAAHQHETDARVDYWFQARSGDKPAIDLHPTAAGRSGSGQNRSRGRNQGINARVRQIESQASQQGITATSRGGSHGDQFNTLRGCGKVQRKAIATRRSSCWRTFSRA